jgi:hypothetical protein
MRVKIGSYPKHRWYHNWLYDKFGYVSNQKMSIQIDEFDTWSMDHTLAYIIEPMLKQLKDTKHGSPSVADEDVPAEIRSTVSPSNGDDIDGHWHDRWDYVLNEMIYAFDSKANQEDVWFRFKGEELKKEQQRIANGFKLFGKYYENLWD